MAGHNPDEVASVREAKLRHACAHLGVSHLEPLRYHDSGMAKWRSQHREGAFCAVPVESAAARITQLIDFYRPQVVVTHDPHSTGHPDHVHTAHVATHAVDSGQVVAKLYYKAHGGSYWRLLNQALADIGIHRPSPSAEKQRVLDFVDQQITTVIDVDHVIDRKRAALHSHASQNGSSLGGKLPATQFRSTCGIESYIRVRNTTATRATCLTVIRIDRAHD